jgi:serine/threonine protein kinase
MQPEVWKKVEELVRAAQALSPEKRAEFLKEACPDAQLRGEVVSLLTQKVDSFLESSPLHSALPPVTKLGHFEILGMLGRGGMGEVYRGRDSKLGRDVAIKILPDEFARDPKRLARFRREARTLASLNHPNIAAIYGLEESGGMDCLVLELVEGETLHGPLPVPTALDRARQVAEALEAAHAKGIIHRDLKPGNVKVTLQGWVKVLDFGLAKAIWGLDENQDLSRAADKPGEETLSGIVGTPGYMSPEQARGKEVDERTDVWAFGCLLYELLTGKRAFHSESNQDIMSAVLEREPDWKALPPKTPAPVRELLLQCLQKDAGRRLQRISDARRTIEVGPEIRPRSGDGKNVLDVLSASALRRLPTNMSCSTTDRGKKECRPMIQSCTFNIGYAQKIRARTVLGCRLSHISVQSGNRRRHSYRPAIRISLVKRRSRPNPCAWILGGTPRMDRDISGVILSFACKPVRYHVLVAKTGRKSPIHDLIMNHRGFGDSYLIASLKEPVPIKGSLLGLTDW